MKIFDISPIISSETAVYPGDVPFKREVAMDMDKGDHLTLSSLSTTLHIGAHADAPSHYHQKGETIDQRALTYYVGPCQVVDVSHCQRGERVRLQDLGGQKIHCERVLFYTNSFPDPTNWNSDFCSLSPELIDFLAAQNVILVGLDTPSVDPETSKKLESHQALYKNNMANLEGLVLSEVPAGIYQLVALPLKLKSADASPVRAILIQEDS